MAIYAKKRKPFILRFFVAIFWIIFILALVLGGLWCYLYFSKNINYIGAITQISALSNPVDENTLVTNAPSENDLTNVNAKLQVSTLSSDIAISDKEFCAYVNDKIVNGNISADIGNTEVSLKDMNMQVLQVEFSTSSQSDVLANINVIFKFDTTTLKQQLNVFPLSLLANSFPQTIYVSATGKLLSTANDDYSYTIQPTELKLNNLTASDSTNFLNFFNIFTKFGTAEELNIQILNLFCDQLIGNVNNPGIYHQLSQNVAVGYETNFAFLSHNFNISVDVAKYDVKVIQTLGETQNVNAGTITGTGEEFLYGNNTTLEVSVNNGYKFLGWYNSNHTLISSTTTVQVTNITSDILYYAQFEYITKNITYHLDGKKCDNFNSTTYNISDGTIVLQKIYSAGYTFLGWYKDNITKIEVIDASTMIDYDLYAKWDLIEYNITYHLNDGVAINLTTYTTESATFILNNPTKADTTFTGWTGTNLTEKTFTVQITQGSVGDLEFYAHYANDTSTYTVTLVVDDTQLTNFEIDATSTLTTSIIDSNAKGTDFDMTGYSVDNWYTDSTKQTPFTETTLTANLTLYGNWSYFMDNMLFLPYYEEFTYANNHNSSMTFESQEELVAWIDYVMFYHVSRGNNASYPTFTLSYSGISNKTQEVKNAYENIWCETINFQTVTYSYTYSANFFYLCDSKDAKYNVSLMAQTPTSNTDLINEQCDDAMIIKNTNPRTESKFPIDNVTKTISNISNTEQLVRVLEQGYKPEFVASSSAETIYNKAKLVLKEICNDDMTDVQKLQAIYEWLALNVQYDYNILQESLTSAQTRLYEAWFPEGVFNSGLAVCEGYAKSALIMARIEGIPAVYVVGNGHAWNKVQVGGVWYEFDATHGDSTLDGGSTGSDIEVITYIKFLFPSSYRSNYVATYYTNIICNTSYDFYAGTTYTYNNTEFDLAIDSQQELELLMRYVKNNIPTNVEDATKYSFEFVSNINNIAYYYNRLTNIIGGSWGTLQYRTDSADNKFYLVIMNK